MRIVVVPAAPGLLPCEGLVDPFEDARSACIGLLRNAVDSAESVAVLGSEGIAESLLRQAGFDGVVWSGARDSAGSATRDLVVISADGSATRTEKAPGYFDERSADFDKVIENALAQGDAEVLAAIDPVVAEELWCRSVPAFHAMAQLMPSPARAELLYADCPYGVAYWVATWTD